MEQQAASPVGPATTARAMIVFKLDVSDQVVVQDYRRVRADHAEFSGHGVFMIDAADGTAPAPQLPILWWFFDSEGYPPQPARGGLARRRTDLGEEHATGYRRASFRGRRWVAQLPDSRTAGPSH